jgi:hypothetical protein
VRCLGVGEGASSQLQAARLMPSFVRTARLGLKRQRAAVGRAAVFRIASVALVALLWRSLRRLRTFPPAPVSPAQALAQAE